MEDIEIGAIRLELKYCERCGGLWLRPAGSDLIFCGACAKAMAGLVPEWRRRARAGHFTQADEGIFWGEGGNA